MRYYDIQIQNAPAGARANSPASPSSSASSGTSSSTSSGTLFRQYTSFPNQRNDPGALDIELNIQMAPLHQLGNINSYVRVYGVPLSDVSQATRFNDCPITIYGGMQAGLPLANPAQSGLLAQGTVSNAFGNWLGTTQTLDLYLRPDVGTHESPKDLVLWWPEGMDLATAVMNCIEAGLPGYVVVNRVTKQLINAFDEQHAVPTLEDLALFVNSASVGVANVASYPGISMVIKSNQIILDDSTTQQNPKQIAFNDLIGQPTWIDSRKISVTTVMRADISPTDWVKMPPTVYGTAPSAAQATRQNASFSGTFQVTEVYHTGRFRDADAHGWITTIICVAE